MMHMCSETYIRTYTHVVIVNMCANNTAHMYHMMYMSDMWSENNTDQNIYTGYDCEHVF